MFDLVDKLCSVLREFVCESGQKEKHSFTHSSFQSINFDTKYVQRQLAYYGIPSD